MISILVSTHGNLGEELVETARMIVGEQDALDYYCIRRGDDIAQWSEELIFKTHALDQGDGVLILTDVFGGSPANAIAGKLGMTSDNSVRCITGTNLPLLLEALGTRETLADLDKLVEHCIASGRDSILDLFGCLNKRVNNRVG